MTTLDVGTCNERTSFWTTWNDRDNPSATGDWELLHLRPDARLLCRDPLAAQARVVGTTALETTQNVSLTQTGLSCINAENPEGCFDYEVRFCCPQGI